MNGGRGLKTLALVAVLAFLVASFAFLDGWPFRRGRAAPAAAHEEAATLGSATTEEGPVAAQPRDPEAGSDGSAVPSRSDEVVMAAREALAGTRDGDLGLRLRALSTAALRRELPADFRDEQLAELRELARGQVNRGARGLAVERVVVATGDNLTLIARRVQKAHGSNVTPALVMRLNGLRSDRIRVGQVLQVPTGRLAVIVSKSDHRLYLVLDEVIIADYPVGLGRGGCTPEGEFEVVNKTVNPSWRAPDGRLLPHGHPDHIIGNRWLGFADADGPTSYGIHGTTDPDSIGKDESDGCVRMLAADVEEVFRLVPEGCPVRLTP